MIFILIAKCKTKKKFEKIFSKIDKDCTGTFIKKDFLKLMKFCLKGNDDVASNYPPNVLDAVWEDLSNEEGEVECNTASEWIFS